MHRQKERPSERTLAYFSDGLSFCLYTAHAHHEEAADTTQLEPRIPNDGRASRICRPAAYPRHGEGYASHGGGTSSHGGGTPHMAGVHPRMAEGNVLRMARYISSAYQILRCHPMNIPGKQCGTPHILKSQQSCGKALQSKSQTSMRRHAVPVHHQIFLKELQRHSSALHLLYLLLIIMNTLSSGGNLQPPKQQVKA